MENFKSESGFNESYERGSGTSHSFHNTTDSCNCHACYCPTWDYQFFSGIRRQHYKVLYENVFCYLEEFKPLKTPRVPIGMSLPEYNPNLPPNDRIYEEAVLHMKMENGDKTLDVLINDYKTEILKVNNSNYDKSQAIYGIIEKNFTNYNIKSKDDKWQIIDKVDQLLIEIFNAIDVDIWFKEAPKPEIAGFHQKGLQCLRAIIKDQKIRDFMFEVKGEKVQLDRTLHAVQDEAKSISRSIQNQDYYVVAECCPSFWKMIYLTFFRFPHRKKSK